MSDQGQQEITTQTELFISDDGQVQLDLKLEQETLWLTQAQISQLFETSTDNVGLHLKNIYSEEELTESATTEDFSVVRQEGKRQRKSYKQSQHLIRTKTLGNDCYIATRVSSKEQYHYA